MGEKIKKEGMMIRSGNESKVDGEDKTCEGKKNEVLIPICVNEYVCIPYLFNDENPNALSIM